MGLRHGRTASAANKALAADRPLNPDAARGTGTARLLVFPAAPAVGRIGFPLRHGFRR